MEDKAIVSSTYIVFKVKKTEKLLPKYLLLWFKRDEFDRYARYHSWGSARKLFHGIIYVKLNYQFLVLIFKNQL